MEYTNFGGFISQKRTEKGKTMREVAEALAISAPFLSDVEKGNRNAFDFKRLELLADVLELSANDKTIMMDLAGDQRGTVAPDIIKYIMENNYVGNALRMAKKLGATDSDWQRFADQLTASRKFDTSNN